MCFLIVIEGFLMKCDNFFFGGFVFNLCVFFGVIGFEEDGFLLFLV